MERELLLIKVKADAQSRSAIMQIVEIFRAKIVDVSPEVLIIEMTGTREKVSALMELLAPFGVVELMRTGRIAMSRGKGHLEARASRPCVTCHDAPNRR